MTEKIEDSLDNLSNTKLRQQSLQKQRIQVIQVKQKFVSLLQKLQSSQTRQISIAELKKLIQKNREPQHLRTYISIMKTLKPNANSTTKQHQVLVFSILAQVFKKDLIDSIDKPPSLLKTVFKLIQILHGFFNDTSSTVQQACAKTLMDFNYHCLQSEKIQQKINLLFTPLISILKNGVDKASQSTATVCINQLIQYWYKTDKQYLDYVMKQMLQTVFKVSSQYHELFMAVATLIDYKGLLFFQNKLVQFLSKILPIINGTRQQNQNFNAYMTRVNICKIIQKIGLLLNQNEKEKLIDLNVVQCLQKAARNKIIQVQMAATRAIKIWKGQKIPQQRSSSLGRPLKTLQQLRNDKKRQRSHSKQQQIKIQKQLDYMKQDLQKMVKGGWGANNRAKNYVKKGFGVGGGHYGTSDSSTPPKNNKSHKQHIQQLRELVKKGGKQYKDIDRFQLLKVGDKNKQIVNERQRSRQSTPPKIKNKTSPRPKQSVKSNENGHEEDDFNLVQNQGEQMVYIPQRQNKSQRKIQINASPKNSDNLISAKEASELLLEQKQIMKDAKNIDFYSQINSLKDQKNQQKQKKNSAMSEQYKPISFTQPRTQFVQNKGNLSAKDSKQKDSRLKIQKYKNLSPMISKEELEELILDNNLSGVSQNFDNILNESDLNENQDQNAFMNSIDSNKSNKQKNLMTKKNKVYESAQSDNQKAQNSFGNSLNYTQSKISKFKQSNREPTKNGVNQQQFTLNPNIPNNNKFESIYTPNQDQVNQEIEQDIVESCYQQSIPKDKNLLPLKTRVKETQKPKQKNQNNYKIDFSQYKIPPVITDLPRNNSNHQESKNFQNLIHNPPSYSSKLKVDKKSMISQRQSEDKTQIQDNEDAQNVSEKWMQILKLVQDGQINEAFQKAIILNDPIYLLRLLIITKTPLGQLTAQNTCRLWRQFLNIYKHRFISVLFTQIFSQAQQLQLVKSTLTIQQINETLIQLYQISGNTKGKLSYNAAQLYNTIDKSLKNSQ